MRLEIVTPEATVFDGDVEAVLVPGKEGQLGILPNHEPLLTALRPGELVVIDGGKREHFALAGGFVEVRPGSRVVVLAHAAEAAEDIDEARALEAKRRAEELLKEKREEVKFTEASVALERALARLKVAQRKRRPKAPTVPEIT